MARFNFREVQQRFQHIDAHFESCNISMAHSGGAYSVKLYPWWEHPAYVAAISAGRSWGFTSGPDARRIVTVYPINPVEVRLTKLDLIIEWEFLEEHYLLWSCGELGKIICNAPMTFDLWMEVLTKTKPHLADREQDYDICQYVDFAALSGIWSSQSYCLGSFPRPLYRALTVALRECGLPFYSPGEPTEVTRNCLLLIDDDNYIIADDFELDVPEFVHKPEWFIEA